MEEEVGGGEGENDSGVGGLRKGEEDEVEAVDEEEQVYGDNILIVGYEIPLQVP